MTYITIAERMGLEKGRKEGMQKGIQKGMQKGRIERLRQAIALLMDARFGQVDPELSERLKTVHDTKLLEKILYELEQSSDLQQFKEKVQSYFD